MTSSWPRTERLVVITGPEQGGKTSFARAIGQLHHLAAIGVPVPGSAARLGLGDAVHTLFARAEDPADLTGRLEAELTRARSDPGRAAAGQHRDHERELRLDDHR